MKYIFIYFVLFVGTFLPTEQRKSNFMTAHVRNSNLLKAKSAALRKKQNITVLYPDEILVNETKEEEEFKFITEKLLSSQQKEYTENKGDDGIITILFNEDDDRSQSYSSEKPTSKPTNNLNYAFDEKTNKTWKTGAAGGAKKGGGPVISLHGFKSPEQKLVEYLLDGYNKHVRPVNMNHDPTSVFFEIALFNVLEMDTKNRKMITNTEMIMIWKDLHLAWDPAKFSGVEIIRIPYYDIWYPDIILHNTGESNYQAAIINTFAIIAFDGTVELLSHALFTSVCDVDVTWYPFDQQTCEMIFSSWTYDNTGIVMENGPADLSEYVDNPEFYLEDFRSHHDLLPDPCCANPFSTIFYNIQIQRRTKFSLFFYIMPGILINVCAVLVFSLPAEAGEKVGLGINSMIAMIVFLMAMTENLPPTQKIPLAGMYYGVCLTVITLNIAFSVYVQNLNYTGFRGYQVSVPVRYVTVVVARILLIKIPDAILEAWEFDDDDDDDPSQITQVTPIESLDGGNEDLVQVFSVDGHKNKDEKMNLKNNLMTEDIEFKDPYQRRTIKALEYLANITVEQEKRFKKEKKREGLRDEWKFISRVLDRFLFITFGIIALLFNIIILTSSPFGEEFAYCPTFMSTCEGLSEEFIIAELHKHTAFSGDGGHGDDGGGHGDDGGGHGDKGGGHGDKGGGHGDKGGGHGDSGADKSGGGHGAKGAEKGGDKGDADSTMGTDVKAETKASTEAQEKSAEIKVDKPKAEMTTGHLVIGEKGNNEDNLQSDFGTGHGDTGHH